MDIQIIMEKLRYMDDPYLEAAFTAALEHQAEITPELLAVVHNSIQNSQHPFGLGDYTLCIHSLYLLAYFREKQAYPLIIDLFSTPDDTALELTGNMFIEDLGRILASVCSEDISLIQHMIENNSVHQLLRASAIESLVVLVAVGIKSRMEIISYFQSLYQGGLERSPSLVWNSLTACCVDLYPEEVFEDIIQCFHDELIDESYIDLDQVEEALDMDREEALEKLLLMPDYTLIDDIFKEIKVWSSDYLEEEEP